MFTGIIRHVGKVTRIADTADSAKVLTIATPLSKELHDGDSVAVNGACLTVLSASDNTWDLRLMHETLAKTNLGALQVGSQVNLERPISLNTPLDGHFVQGHVDGVCEIVDVTSAGDDRIFTFRPPTTLLPNLIPKGSVA